MTLQVVKLDLEQIIDEVALEGRSADVLAESVVHGSKCRVDIVSLATGVGCRGGLGVRMADLAVSPPTHAQV